MSFSVNPDNCTGIIERDNNDSSSGNVKPPNMAAFRNGKNRPIFVSPEIGSIPKTSVLEVTYRAYIT